MPRGKRKTSREKLEELRETIEELLKQQKEEDLRRLAQMMEEQQVSADKLAEILKEARISRAADRGRRRVGKSRSI